MISVVIPTRDRPDALRATLVGLRAQRYPGPAEVIVVDDGRTGETQRVLRHHPDVVRVVDGPRTGRAAARNAGASAARGGRLLFLDDDILTRSGHLRVHAVATGLAHGPLREFPVAGRWLAEHAGAPAGVLAHQIEAVVAGRGGRLVRNVLEALVDAMADGSVPPVAPWAACIGANTSLPRADFDSVGGFDEGFGLGWGCEDLELGVRLVDAGVRAVVAQGAGGVHLTRARPGRWRQQEANLRQFVARHDRPAIRALPALLSENGSVAAYLAACGALDPGPGGVAGRVQ